MPWIPLRIDRLTTQLVLAYPCFTKPFVPHSDASGLGLGAVLELEQEDRRLHPVPHASRTLSSLRASMEHLRAYLLGHSTVHSFFAEHNIY